MEIVLRSHDANGKIHKRHLKLDKKYDMLIPYFLDVLELDREDLKAFVKERFAKAIARASNAFETPERELNMSSNEIMDRCKKDEAFKVKARKILNDAIKDSDVG